MRRTGSSARSRPTCTDRATRTNPNPGSESSTSTNSAPPTTTTPSGVEPATARPRRATTRHTRAIFELKWAPATPRKAATAGVRVIAQADAGGYVSAMSLPTRRRRRHSRRRHSGNTGSSSLTSRTRPVRRRGGLAWRRGADWSPADTGGSEYSVRLAVVGAIGGARIRARVWRPEVVDEERAHDLEAWARAPDVARSNGGGSSAPAPTTRLSRPGLAASTVRLPAFVNCGRTARASRASRRRRTIPTSPPGPTTTKSVGLPIFAGRRNVRRRRLRRGRAASRTPRGERWRARRWAAAWRSSTGPGESRSIDERRSEQSRPAKISICR